MHYGIWAMGLLQTVCVITYAYLHLILVLQGPYHGCDSQSNMTFPKTQKLQIQIEFKMIDEHLHH